MDFQNIRCFFFFIVLNFVSNPKKVRIHVSMFEDVVEVYGDKSSDEHIKNCFMIRVIFVYKITVHLKLLGR